MARKLVYFQVFAGGMIEADNRGEYGELNFPTSEYKTPDQVSKTNNLTILSANVQSIKDITHEIAPSFLCLQEVWGQNTTKDYSI